MQTNLLNLQKEEIGSKIGWTITSLSLREIPARGPPSGYVIVRNVSGTVRLIICLEPESDIVIFPCRRDF